MSDRVTARPEKKHFSNTKWDNETRTFTGVIDWRPDTVGWYGASSEWYQMIFSEDFSTIESGLIQYNNDANVILFEHVFGQDIFYRRSVPQAIMCDPEASFTDA